MVKKAALRASSSRGRMIIVPDTVEDDVVSSPEAEEAVVHEASNRVYVKCRARRLVKLISGLNEAQRLAVNKVGFGGLLSMKISQFPLEAVPVFLKAFDDGTHMFKASETKEFLVTKHDVHDCFMLPYGPNQLDLVPTGRSKLGNDDVIKGLKESWRTKYGVKSVSEPIPLGKVLEDLEADEEGGDEFKRLFVIFSMSTFLCPTSNNGVDIKLLKAVVDVDAISQFDWCSYVLDCIVHTGLESRRSPRFTLGCIPFLMITYFHHFDFRGEVLPHDIPFIKHWDEDMLNKRVRAELMSGCLGRAPWSAVKFPRCLQPVLNSGAINADRESPIPIEVLDGDQAKLPLKKYTQIMLPEGVDDDEELKAKAVDRVHELYLKLQRNAVAFHAWYSRTTDEIKRLTSEPYTSLSLSEHDVQTQSTQSFFEDIALHRYFDEVTEIARLMKDSASKAPSFQPTSTHNRSPDPVNEGDGCQLISDRSSEQATALGNIKNVLFEIQEEERRDAGKDGMHGTDTGSRDLLSMYIPVSDRVNHPFLFHSATPLSCMVVVPENLGCSVDCGAPDTERLIVSEALLCNKSLYSTVFSLRKDVMDYVFYKSESVNKMEALVFYRDTYFIPREDIWYLYPGEQVSNSVIDCWSMLLNHLMYTKHASIKTSRCFFGLSHCLLTKQLWKAKKEGTAVDVSSEVFATWDLWIKDSLNPFQLDSDMVFIPSLSGQGDHFSCVFINFKSCQVEYLDNRSYGEEFESMPYVAVARIEADLMGDYMMSKGLTKGARVRGFKLVNIPFSWQGVGYSAHDCGVYMMVHMLLYCGLLFECGLGSSDAINLCRAEMAATLVLSDINKHRADVLSRVAEFNTSKVIPMNKSSMDTPKSYAPLLPPSKSTASKRKKTQNKVIEKNKRPRESEPETEPFTPDVVPISSLPPRSKSVSAVSSRCWGKGDGLGCSLNCGEAKGGTLVVSKFLRANQALLKPLADLRKQVADYCFLDDYDLDPREVVADYGNLFKLDRDDIRSMHPNTHMFYPVIDCWALLLNKMEDEEEKPSRMTFFGTRHTDKILKLLDAEETRTQDDQLYGNLLKEWDTFVKEGCGTVDLNADFIFVPLNLDMHYFCICINFISRTVDVLDHTNYSDFENSDVYRASKLMAGCMGEYLESKGIDKYAVHMDIKVRQIKLNWQTSAPNNKESGLFTMMHMLCYEGSPFPHNDLERKITRRYLVIELACILVLADMNRCRANTLLEVQKLEADKPKIWKELYARRKIDEIKAKKKL